MNYFQVGREPTPEEAVTIFPLLIRAWTEVLNLLIMGLGVVDDLSIVTMPGSEDEIMRLIEWAEAVRPIAIEASRGLDGQE
jgi:hypothetical protein